MADLSQAANALMQAFTRGNPALMADPVYRSVAADAQRAAATYILTCKLKYLDGGPFDGGFNLGLQRAADELNGIANELESQ
jgi:hypothetical protein